jgi:anti-sigma regulatory factor (Ser/Thr protein kinase)
VAVEVDDITIDIGDHVVQFYDREPDLVCTVGAYIAAAVRSDEVAIVIATENHRQGFEREVRAAGVDLDAARARGLFVALDAATTLAAFVTDGRVDAAGFTSVVGGVVRSAAATERPVRAYGEMVALLWEAGDVLAAIELEGLWNELAGQLPFSLLCAYPSAAVAGRAHADALREVCHLHSAVVRPATPSQHEASEPFEARLDAPRAARRFVIDTLGQWGQPDELVNDAALVVTELASNAVRHARSPFWVVMSGSAGSVRVSVRDRSQAPPIVRPRQSGAPLTQSGRGLALVASLAARWGTEIGDDGKVVWAELRPSHPRLT